MTQSNYTRNILNIKDININFYENCLETRIIKGVETKVFRAYLTYHIHVCPFCKHEGSIIKWNWKRNCKIKIPKVSNYNAIILLDKQRFNIKFIVMDMFEPYYKLFKTIFPNAVIITDKFHVVALASNALKCTRVKCMKHDKKNYNKLKHYWKLIQKFEDDLDKDKKKYSVYFGKEITDYEIVTYIINTNSELKATYEVYQGILRSIKNKDVELFTKIITSKQKSISEYMKNTLKTFNKFSYHIINSFKFNLNNGVIEGVNNLIKCIKRIAFGYRSFYHFKTRIMLIAGIYKYN